MAEVNFLVKKGLTVPKGSASTPSIIFDASDPNTGIYSPGTDQLAISTNGTGRLFVDASGRVGIGTSTFASDSNLEIKGATSSVVRIISANNSFGAITFGDTDDSSTGGIVYDHSDDSLALYGYNNTERLRITSDGKLGLGTSTVDELLHLKATAPKVKIEGTGTSDEVGIHFAANSNNWFIRSDNSTGQNTFSIKSGTPASSTHRLLIDSSGQVGIGTTSPGSFDAEANQLVIGNGAGAKGLTIYTGTAVGDYGSIFFADGTSGGAVKKGQIRYEQNNEVMSFWTNENERCRIDLNGRLLVGTSTARSNFFNSTNSAAFQLEGQLNDDATASIVQCYNANTQGATLVLGKSNTLTVGANALVADGHTLGRVSYQGNDGTEFVEAASILAQVDGTPGADDMPGRLVFSVTADGASSPTEAMRIKNSRIINIANTPTYADNAAAKAGGLVDGDVYRTSTGVLMIVYT